MPYFMRFVYRFFACVMLLSVAACFAPPSRDKDQGYTMRSAAPAPTASKAADAMAIARAAGANDYAPPTNIKTEGPGAQTTPETAPYGVATRIGEAVHAPTVKVGLLIPMTGSSAALGRSMLDAAILAIYDKYTSMSQRDITARIELLPQDTGDSIEGAEKAGQDAIEAGATIILGPVFGKQVNAVASIARPKGIPVITFSNNATVAGDGVYLFGFIPEQQVIRVIQYAITRKYPNVAALVPSNPYGATIVKQLSTEMRKNGGRAHPIEYYQEDMSALDTNVGRLSRFLQEQQTAGSQALFIAEGGAKLKTLTDLLATNGINSSKVQLLGTGLWDDTDIIKNTALSGGWFASSPPEKYQSFEQHFTSTYTYKPDRRASLSYDAVALAATLAISSNGTGFTTQLIVDPVGFSGPANGIFRFREDGTIERGLSVLAISPTGFRAVDPAPTIFNQ